jgi:HEAT repeat protein
MKNIPDRIREARAEKDWGEVSLILDYATRKDVRRLVPLLKSLLVDRQWLIRASAVEVVGRFRLRQFTRQVRERLSDSSNVVRTCALSAYYDTWGAKALPVIRESRNSRDTRVRTEALVLDYVETGDEEALSQLERLLTRKRAIILNREVAFREFDHYLDLRDHPRVRILLKEMLNGLPKKHGLAQDIRAILAKSVIRGHL